MERSIIKIIFLILLKNIVLSIKYVEIPFTRKKYPSKEYTKEQNIKILENNQMLTEYNIGTQYQKLYLSPNLNDHHTMIIGENSTYKDYTPEDLVEFKHSSSSTYVNKGEFNLTNQLIEKGNYCEDNIKVGNIELKEVYMLIGQQFKYTLNLLHDSGTIGFGSFDYFSSIKKETNFIENLISKKIITSYKFYIKFDNENNGKIIIGGEPHEIDSGKYPGVIKKYARAPNLGIRKIWGFSVDEIKYNNKIIKDEIIYKYTQLKLNYGLISFPEAIRTILNNEFFKTLVDQKICEYISNTYICKKGEFDKSKLSVISIYNMELGRYYDIDLSKLFLDIGDFSYFLVEFKNGSPITLGVPFLKDHIFIIDQNESMVSIYSDTSNNSNNVLKIIIIIISVISAIAIAILSYKIYKVHVKNRNMRGNEILDDNYEYLPKDMK